MDLDTIADMLGQEGAGMAAWYARDADMERKLTDGEAVADLASALSAARATPTSTGGSRPPPRVFSWIDQQGGRLVRFMTSTAISRSTPLGSRRRARNVRLCASTQNPIRCPLPRQPERDVSPLAAAHCLRRRKNGRQ